MNSVDHTHNDACTWLKTWGFSWWFLEDINTSSQEKGEEGGKKNKDHFPISTKAVNQKAVSKQLGNEELGIPKLSVVPWAATDSESYSPTCSSVRGKPYSQAS